MNIILLSSVLLTTIVYSAFSTQLQIQGEAVLRSQNEIRITNLKKSAYTNGAYETYNSKYSKDTTTMYVTMPANSSITYEVEITNKSNKDYDIKNVELITNDNSNIKSTMSLKIDDMVEENKNKKFTIVLNNNTSTEQVGTIGYQYTFSEHIYMYVVGEYSTPKMHTLTIPHTGKYMIELWGAQGNHISIERSVGGLGAYTKGIIELEKDTILYIYVGEHKTTRDASFNCGSTGGDRVETTANAAGPNGYGGGGATDVRIVSGSWDNSSSLRSRIMVAAGGGGGSNYTAPANGGAAGGLIGYDGINAKTHNLTNIPPTGGTQISGGKTTSGTGTTGGYVGEFGKGGNGNIWGSGGGGGYYGGGGAGWSANSVDSGAGGSSYISGHAGSIAITSESDETPKKTTYQTLSDSYHYSGYIFTNTLMIDGKGCKWTTSKTSDCSGQIQPDGTTTTGRSGNGYAKVTLINQ